MRKLKLSKLKELVGQGTQPVKGQSLDNDANHVSLD